ncbi:helix-turn-helix domain-containing protein [Brevundimonas sp.]|uniref:helix-turn-helix domain-containing protein n=1 Tax=Brevundimonas sp. TaxID=1871086 RepID=UPI003D0F5A16
MSDMEIYRLLGLAVAKRRTDKKLTQAEVAAKIGLTRASLANIETGRQKVMLHHLYRLATALDCESILDLAPSTFVFSDESEPVVFYGSNVSDQQRAQLEHFIRTVGTR